MTTPDDYLSLFDKPVVHTDGRTYRLTARGQGATKYIIPDVELLSLIRKAEKLKAIEEFLEEYKSKDYNTQALLAFLDKGKPLPRKS